MLAKLNVRRKLTLLLMLPFFAVFLTSVPFAIGQINTAISAGATVDVAERARLVGVLVQDLQEERLVGLAYLISTDVDRSAFIARSASSVDAAHTVEIGLQLPRDVKLKTAIGGLRALETTRRSVVGRTTDPKAVFDGYHRIITGLIDALGLTQQDKADVTGVRQMNTLDALLRTNEQIGRIGAALVLGCADVPNAVALIEDAQLLRKADATRFRQQADSEENTLLNLVEQGPTGRRSDALTKTLVNDRKTLNMTEVLAASHTMIALTRVQQERIARDIAVRAATRADNARLYAGGIIGGAGLVVGIVILLSIAVSQSVAGPLRQLTQAARRVADIATAELVRVADSEIEDAQPPQLRAVEIQTQDEIGELAEAFNRVQMTAAKLMEQQLATRRNTAVMFANIARRTRSMVARQLTFIDDLERNEQNERLLSKLYRLDHLTTRLHRSADSLLVVSGAREDERIVAPAPLPEVIRSAVAEIEGYQNVQAGPLASVIVAPQLVPDLRLVLAELLENATAFSPPGSPVHISASVGDVCEITIVDHGIGMSDERLVEENRRLVERERLDIVPTSVLGLFVVGRLARRHGLRVELTRTGELGITATVTVPAALFNDSNRPAGPRATPEVEDVTSAPSSAMMEALASSSTLANLPKSEAPQPPRQPVDATAEPLTPRTPQGVRDREKPRREKPTPVSQPEPEPDRQTPVAEVPAAAAPPVATTPEHSEPPVAPVAPSVGAEPATPRSLPPRRGEPVAPLAGEAQAPQTAPAQPVTPVTGEDQAGVGWFVPPPVDLPTTPVVSGTVPPDLPGDQATPPRKPSAPRHAGGDDQPEAPATGPVAPVSRPEPQPVAASGPAHRGLTRRQPGGHLPSFGIGEDDFRASPVTRDAVAERAELEAFAMGTAQAAAARLKRAGLELPEPTFQPQERRAPSRQSRPQAQPEIRDMREELQRSAAAAATESSALATATVAQPAAPPVAMPPVATEPSGPGRGGLTRRSPGTHLSEYLRSTGPRNQPPPRATSRDADAERAALDSFIDGLARAEAAPDQTNHS